MHPLSLASVSLSLFGTLTSRHNISMCKSMSMLGGSEEEWAPVRGQRAICELHICSLWLKAV